MKVWDALTGEEALTLEWGLGSLSSISFSPDGRRIAGANLGDVTVKVWDATPPRQPAVPGQP